MSEEVSSFSIKISSVDQRNMAYFLCRNKNDWPYHFCESELLPTVLARLLVSFLKQVLCALNLKGIFNLTQSDLEAALYSINIIYTFVLLSCDLFELKGAANDTLKVLGSGRLTDSALVIDRPWPSFS